MTQTSVTNEMYLLLTDGDMDYSEYLECLPTQVDQYINQSPANTPEYSQCIKCSYTSKREYGQCII
jgi:hypothetical protein